MHICFLTNEYPKEGFPHGGIGSFVKTIAVALVKRGFEVSVVGINYISETETQNIDGVNIYRLKPRRAKGFSWYLNSKTIDIKLREIHKGTRIDVIESSELGLAFLSKIKNVKYIIRLHGGHHFFAESEKRKINKWKGFQEKRSFKKGDGFIAVSHYVKNHTEKYLSFNNKPVAYINNPIDTDFFKPLKSKKDYKNRIVFAGTVCEKKGVRQLIQSFPFVKKEFPDATLEIYGRDWFFPDGSSYIKILEEKEIPQLDKVANDIRFHGLISYDEIPKVYAEASLCVFPSHMETLGLVAPEAMSMKKAVVFTKNGPGPEVIEDFITGLLCDPYNPEDIANKIIWVFSNVEQTKVMVEKARDFVCAKFDLNSVVNQNIIFFESMLNFKN